MEVRSYRMQDFLELKLQPMQAVFPETGQTPELARDLGTSQEAFTATMDGIPIACIGLVEYWAERRLVWAYLAESAGPHLIALTRKIKQWLRYHGHGRIEAAIDPEFEASIRWANLLGFGYEGLMRQYVRGKDFYLYARIGG